MNIIPRKYDAVFALVGGHLAQVADGTIKYIDGQTPPTEDEINTKLAEMQAEYNAQEYARSRKEEYDLLNQFELISDDDVNGTTTHKDAIAVIKAKYPKP
jgi:hypothetical protein